MSQRPRSQPSLSGTAQAPRMSKAHTNLSSSEDSLAARLREAVQQRDLARQDASQHLQKLDKLQVAPSGPASSTF